MKIVIDLQAAQSKNSRTRGIGRYSMALAQAMVRNKENHEILIALNGLFPETIQPIKEAFAGLLPETSFHVWYAAGPVAQISSANRWRKDCAELIREAFLANLKPDVVLVTSLFEGLSDDAVSSVASKSHNYLTAITLYDLIPFINQSVYLENPVIRDWYLEKITHLQNSDLWLAISESARQEGIEHLNLPEQQTFNISTDADPHFQKIDISPDQATALRSRYKLTKPFVMYTGGIDHRKNIEGLIHAFSILPKELLANHQLAIVCSLQPDSRATLESLGHKYGLPNESLVITGFVAEDDLVALYNLCSLFAFPSWHEGFGLPALEAMRCGAPVIAANTSSLPEVVGLDDALFDPHSVQSITAALERALSDKTHRELLVTHGLEHAKKFSWDITASRAISAMECAIALRAEVSEMPAHPGKQKLAYVSPLPPERSGIADYSAELIPSLAAHYDIDVIVSQGNISDPRILRHCTLRTAAWFLEHRSIYDRVLYHFGNSTFHQHMFDLLSLVPGVVVLHDFFLSGILGHLELSGSVPGAWSAALYHSHGYRALHDRFHEPDSAIVIGRYPCNLQVIQDSLAVIVHSPESYRLAEAWYGEKFVNWSIIPLLRESFPRADKATARHRLGIAPDKFLVCAFGILAPTKLNDRLIDSWLSSDLGKSENCHLMFVGEASQGDYGQLLAKKIRNKNISITGWVSTNDFREYLSAADMGVQLRTMSRGETSAAVLDCMNYGLATIVNANGSMADLDSSAVWMVDDDFADESLIDALETLWKNGDQREALGLKARDVILRNHQPETCAALYRDAIEGAYQRADIGIETLSRSIASLKTSAGKPKELTTLACAIADSFPRKHCLRQLLIDVTSLLDSKDKAINTPLALRTWCISLLLHSNASIRPELVTPSPHGYINARQQALQLLDCPTSALKEQLVDIQVGDILLAFIDLTRWPSEWARLHSNFRQHGGEVIYVIIEPNGQVAIPKNSDGKGKEMLQTLAQGHLICLSEHSREVIHSLFNRHSDIKNPPSLNTCPLEHESSCSQELGRPLSNINDLIEYLKMSARRNFHSN